MTLEVADARPPVEIRGWNDDTDDLDDDLDDGPPVMGRRLSVN